jgi:CRISPR-associated protein Cas1
VIKEYLNTLYVMHDQARVRLDHDTLVVEVDEEKALQVPILHLSGLTTFGNVLVSPGVVQRFCEDGRAIVFLSRSGRFVGRVFGPVSGNVLLRQAQYRTVDDEAACISIARAIVAGKLQNSRSMLQRSARDSAKKRPGERLSEAANLLGQLIVRLPTATELNEIRGIEGEGARAVFAVFDHMFTREREAFLVAGRTRRPPLDRTNALLSFLFALIASDCTAALESVGLDPQAGFLHALRPGKPALTLDLMEEMRPILGDRLAVTLVNRGQINPDHFVLRQGGSVSLRDDGRKAAVIAYQTRKADEVPHPVLNRKIPLGLVPHVQARMLARQVRGDLESYVPFRLR